MRATTNVFFGLNGTERHLCLYYSNKFFGTHSSETLVYLKRSEFHCTWTDVGNTSSTTAITYVNISAMQSMALLSATIPIVPKCAIWFVINDRIKRAAGSARKSILPPTIGTSTGHHSFLTTGCISKGQHWSSAIRSNMVRYSTRNLDSSLCITRTQNRYHLRLLE